MRRLSVVVCCLLALAVAGCSDQDFVTDVPLRVVVTSPSGDSVDAARESAIKVTFSEKLAPESVEGAFQLESLGYPDSPTSPAPVAFAASYVDEPVPTVTLTPSAKLPFSTVFKVSVATSLKRARDQGPLPVAVSWTFRTAHPPALRVERIEPADGASGVARDAVVRVTFSEPVKCGSLGAGNATLVEARDPHPKAGGGSAEVAGAWECTETDAAGLDTLDGTVCDADASRCVVTFKPSEGFLFGHSSHLSLTLRGGKASANPVVSARATPYGGQLEKTVAAATHVVDPPALSLTASAPGAEAGQLARDAVFTLTLSEPVDCALLVAPVVMLEQTFDSHPRLGALAGTSAAVPGVWSCTDAAAEERTPESCATKPELCQVVFTPESGFLFEWSSNVTLKIAGGVYTANQAPVELTSLESARATSHGGQLPSSLELSFHVADPPAVAVVGAVPAPGATGVDRSTAMTLTFSEPPDCASLNDANILSLVATPDAHPRITATAGRVPGTWSCPAPDASVPYACLPGQPNDPCVATFVPQQGVLPFEWSTTVALALNGGPFDLASRAVESTRATTLGGQLGSDLNTSWRVADPPVLAVVGAVPAPGATGVDRSTAMTLTFSEPPNCASLNDANILSLVAPPDAHPRITATAGRVPGSWSCPAPDANAPYACLPGQPNDPCVATFVPQQGALPFEWSTTVALALNGGGFDLASRAVESTRATTLGGQLGSDLNASWRVLDPPALALIAVSPADGATGVERSPVLKLTFSEPPNCDSLTDTDIVTRTMTLDPHPRLAGQPETSTLAGTWACPTASAAAPWTCVPGDPNDPCVATFTIDAATLPFEASTVLNLALAGGDYADGEALPGGLAYLESTRATTRGGELPTFAFVDLRIEDPAPQLVVSTHPADGATGVPVAAAPVDIELAEPVACNTVNASTLTTSVTLADGSQDDYAFTVACTDGGKTLTLNPASAEPFPYSATFSVRLAGGAFEENAPAAWPEDAVESDDATSRGGQLRSDYRFTFTTEDPPPMLVKSASPSGDGVGIALSAPIAATFSEALDCSSLTASTFSVRETFAEREDPDAAVPAPASTACSFVCPADGDVAAMRCEHAAFAKSSVIEVSLAGGTGPASSIRSTAATLNGGYLEAPPVVFSFRAQDPEPLVLSSTSPNGQPGANVSALSDVRFTFTRAIRCETALSRFALVDVTNASALVAGTLACTNGAAVGPDVDGTPVIFTPSSPLVVDHTYRATASAGIAAADATVVDGQVRGQLEADASISFVVAFEDLQVVSTVPNSASSLTPIGTHVAIRFNQDVAITSLTPCTSTVAADCNLWVNEGSVADPALAVDLSFVSYDNGSFTATFDPSDPANAPHLKPDTLYTVTLLSGPAGVVGTNGVSHLPVDYTFSFRTSTNALIVSVTPELDATDVEAWAPVCVELVDDVVPASLTAGGPQITLAYEDAFGRTAQVPLDEVNPYSLGGTNGLTANRVCLNVTDAPIPCLAGMRRLLYASLYTATVSTQVRTVSGQSLGAPFSWDFTTRNPPEIAELRVKNVVIDEALVRQAKDVPVNAAIVIRFAEVMDPASLDPANIRVVAEGASTPVAVTLSPDHPATPKAVLVTYAPRLDYRDVGADQGRYALHLLGGSGGLTTLAGNYLESDVVVRFETSPATHLTLSPPELELVPQLFIPVSSLDRALYLPSLASDTVYAAFGGVPIAGMVAQNSAQPRSVTYVANPTFLPNQSATRYVFHTTERVLDFRGNPVPATASIEHTTGTASASTSNTPNTGTAADISPAAKGPTATGDQSFVYTQRLTRALRDRMVGTSYYAAAPGEPDGTLSLEATGGAGCPDAGTRLALRVRHVPGATTTLPDKVYMEVAGPPYMKSGCGYVLKFRQYATANIYNLAAPVTRCNTAGGPPTDIISADPCPTGSPSPGLPYVGESTAPTLSALQVQALDGTLVPAAGATGVFGGTRVVATFSEPVDPASVSDATFSLSGGVVGEYTVEGNVVTMTPGSGLVAGSTYTVTLGGLADLAGNPFGGWTTSFTVETDTPTFDNVAFDATATRHAPYGEVALTFSEPVDAATLTVNANASPGSVSLAASGTRLFGCATVDPAEPKRVLWRPAEPLAPGVTVEVTVNAATATVKLTDRAGTEGVETSRSFTP